MLRRALCSAAAVAAGPLQCTSSSRLTAAAAAATATTAATAAHSPAAAAAAHRLLHTSAATVAVATSSLHHLRTPAAVAAAAAPRRALHQSSVFRTDEDVNDESDFTEEGQDAIPSERVEQLVEQLVNLTVIEASQLNKLLKKKLGLPDMPMGGGMMMPMGGECARARIEEASHLVPGQLLPSEHASVLLFWS